MRRGEGRALIAESIARPPIAGRYRLEGYLGAGSAGEVWRAADLVLGREVAVRLLRPEFAGHPQTLARIRADARLASSVSHPAIAAVYDFAEATRAHPPGLVTELVYGRALTTVLASGPVSPVHAMDMLARAAAGLSAAHAARLVHGDIKPGNLMTGPGGAVKITDFGIACAAGSGTPAYLAPERMAGGAATPAGDLYSLGVVVYECLAGAPPFTGTAQQIAAARRRYPLPPLPPTVPRSVAELVAALTAGQPAARPGAATVAARAAELTVALTGSRPVPGRYPPAREPAAGPSLTQVLLAPSASSRRRRARSRPQPVARLAVAGVAGLAVAGLGGWLLLGSGGGQAPAAAVQTSRSPTAQASRTTAPRTTAHRRPRPRVVQVHSEVLAGLPVRAVRWQLRQLGLPSRVVWVATARQRPGNVVSVQPSGRVRRGTMMTVTTAKAPPHHQQQHHHHGGGGHGG